MKQYQLNECQPSKDDEKIEKIEMNQKGNLGYPTQQPKHWPKNT